MIRLECSNCQTVLNIDDAFAGGVCRCQYCGTIQTVPKLGQQPTEADATSQKALFKRKARIESALSPYNDQLDKAADQLDNNGHFSPSSLESLHRGTAPAGSNGKNAATSVAAPASTQTKPPTSSSPKAVAAAPAKPARDNFVPKPSKAAAVQASGKPRKWIIIASVAVSAVAIGFTTWFVSGRSKPVEHPRESVETPLATTEPTTQPAGTATVQTPAVDATSSPGICGIPLQGTTVCYVLDRSGCTQETFQRMVNACLKSAESLTSSRSFQVIVWNNNQELIYPAAGPGLATATNLAGCRTALAETYAATSDISVVMTKAMAGSPQEVVLVSSVDLDEPTATDIRKVIEGKTVILHGIAVGNDLVGDQLRLLAVNTQGKFQRIDIAALP